MTEPGASGGPERGQDQPADIPASTPGTGSTGQARVEPSDDEQTTVLPPVVPNDGPVPGQSPDAPGYVPPPDGMTTGGVLSPEPSAPNAGWAYPAPAPVAVKRSNRIAGAIVAIIGIALIAIVAGVLLGVLPSDKGKILFGTAVGSNLCSVGNQTTTVSPTDPIYFAAILKHHMDGNQAITFHVTKDGVEFVTHEEPADGTSFDCYGNKESLGSLDVGTYVFEVLHDGTQEAVGTLAVK